MLNNLRLIVFAGSLAMSIASFTPGITQADDGSPMPATTVLDSTDWDSLPFTNFSTLEAVNPDGSSAYPSNQFPIKMVGIVLNNPVDMTDSEAGGPLYSAAQPTAFSAGSFNPNPYWQVFVQTISPGDFGGAAVYTAQNYENIASPFSQDDGLGFSAQGWTDNVNRVSLNQTLQAGDIVTIEALGGEEYGGKFNINEEHEVSSNTQFRLIIDSTNNAIPTTKIHLSDILDAGNNFLFDQTRQTGPEHYQSTMVELDNVELVSSQPMGDSWTSNGYVEVQDGLGRTFTLQLGTNSGFDGPAPVGFFDVTGIFDQESGSDFSANANMQDYELWVMDPSAVVSVPEPAGIVLGIFGLACLWKIRRSLDRS